MSERPFDIVSVAGAMIAVDTSSDNSNLPLMQILVPLCRQSGLKTRLVSEQRDGINQYDLIAWRGDLEQRPLALSAHTDTVPPGDPMLWTATDSKPLTLTEAGGYLYGLGVADVKLDLLCKLVALASLKDVPLSRGVVLLGTYGEETGRWGAKLLTRDWTGAPGAMLVGEPSRLRPCPAHKGYVEFRVSGLDPSAGGAPPGPYWRLRFHGVAAHSSQTHLGASANRACLQALRMLCAETDAAVLDIDGGDVVNKVSARCEALVAAPTLPRVEAPRHLDGSQTGHADGAQVALEVVPHPGPAHRRWSPGLVATLFGIQEATEQLEGELRRYRDPSFDPPFGTVNNGRVQLSDGGLQYVADVRCLPGTVSEAAVEKYSTALDHLAASSGPLEITLERALDSRPFQADTHSPLLRALSQTLRRHGLPTQPEMKSGTTEAPVYQAAGWDTVIFGPGQASGNIHKPNERIAVEDLSAAIDVYRDLIVTLCE